MNDNKMITKPYNSNYKNQLSLLFKKTFKRELSEAFWNWRFEKNPFGEPIIRVAFFNKLLIANYLLHPINLQYNSKSIKALFSMTTMTDPDFVGRGIGTKLANEAYHIGKENKFDLVFGFLNKNSRYMFTKKLGFTELAIMKEIIISVENHLNFKSNYSCTKITEFDEEHSIFYKSKSKGLSKILIPRTSTYLNWRFVRHPEINYHCYNVKNNEKLVGYFVLKIFQNNKCHIVDFLLDDDIECFNAIINQTIKFCKENNIQKLSLWANSTLQFTKYLSKIGFKNQPMETYFVTKIFSKYIDQDFLNFDNWYICMSDSDVF